MPREIVRLRDCDILFLLLQEVLRQHILQITLLVAYEAKSRAKKRKRGGAQSKYDIIARMPDQEKHLSRMIGLNDVDCISNLRMDRNTFGRLCRILRERGGLVNGRHVIVEEQVAMFLSVLAHHKKNRVVKFDFWRSGQTISHYVHAVLGAILRIHDIFLAKPEAVPDDCTDPRWQWFKGCLGALDGTYVNVMVSNNDKARYRTRKGQISTNVLGVCDRNLKFVYVLSGWEGSAADSRILRDAINRPHGLKVPKGFYYLCDNGYANSEGFLTPFKGVRYHLKEWGPNSGRPQNKEELFNLRHSKARNVIERAFGILKMRWGILRSTTFYPIKIQNRLIMAAFLINNFIRSEMAIDPIEQQFDTMEQALGDNEVGHVLIFAMKTLNSQLKADFTLHDVETRVDFLRDRYVSFKYLHNLPETDWDASSNVLHAHDELWRRLFKENSFFQAYHHNGEPEFFQLCKLFGLYDVKEEISHTVVVIEDSTPSKKNVSFVDLGDSASDDEVNSPIIKPKPIVCRKIIVEDACSSVSPGFPNSHTGHVAVPWSSIKKKFAAPSGSSVPPKNAFPGRPKENKKPDSTYGGSSCASSSPFK
ncbi:uncharacterized protein LOC130993805 [Salvia miltiorrhiza]|uniref:uncharacterized protein LOC130993805 n=1 Tax=Salvia miltiorrhiza TaxID=226208 RepID=UPI0025AD8BDF|nr:uncharacterized protein LOC130993805 [Salvia miltiorrhiza]